VLIAYGFKRPRTGRFFLSKIAQAALFLGFGLFSVNNPGNPVNEHRRPSFNRSKRSLSANRQIGEKRFVRRSDSDLPLSNNMSGI
jgi:hypothetical protein